MIRIHRPVFLSLFLSLSCSHRIVGTSPHSRLYRPSALLEVPTRGLIYSIFASLASISTFGVTRSANAGTDSTCVTLSASASIPFHSIPFQCSLLCTKKKKKAEPRHLHHTHTKRRRMSLSLTHHNYCATHGERKVSAIENVSAEWLAEMNDPALAFCRLNGQALR